MDTGKKRKLKICVLTHTFPRFDGDTSAPFMGNIVTALGELGHKVFVLVPHDPKVKTRGRGPYKLITYKYAPTDKLHKLGYSQTFKEDKNVSFSTYLLSPFMFIAGFFALVKLINKEGIDIVNSHWIIPNGFIAALGKFVTGVPFTSTIPGSDVHVGGKNEVFRRMVGFAQGMSDYVISDSQHYINQLNELGFYPRNVDLIRYGVNAREFKPTVKNKKILISLGLEKTDPTIVCVGRLVEKKGFIYLVRAMVAVLKKMPDAKLVIVGEGYERDRLEKEVTKLKLERNIIFAGTISYNELSKYYNIADVFVMPSIKDEKGNLDASPVTMMEAMACGVPVVATKFAGSGDLIIKGKTGFLVKEKAKNEIADAIISLLTKGTKKDTCREVRRVAVRNFSVRSVAKRYERIFRQIIK